MRRRRTRSIHFSFCFIFLRRSWRLCIDERSEIYCHMPSGSTLRLDGCVHAGSFVEMPVSHSISQSEQINTLWSSEHVFWVIFFFMQIRHGSSARYFFSRYIAKPPNIKTPETLRIGIAHSISSFASRRMPMTTKTKKPGAVRIMILGMIAFSAPWYAILLIFLSVDRREDSMREAHWVTRLVSPDSLHIFQQEYCEKQGQCVRLS